jgi:O-antigen ligase
MIGSQGFVAPLVFFAAVAVALAAAIVIVLCLKRYELALALILVSPWVHWLFVTNVEVTVEDVEAVGAGTYIRVAIVGLAGVIGFLKFLQVRSETHEKIPGRFLLLGLFILNALASTAYSISRQDTFVRAAEFAAFFAFLLGLHYWLQDEQQLDRALNVFCVLMAIGLLINLSAIGLAPGKVWWWRSPNRFQGLLGMPNALGIFCVAAYPVFMWRYRRSTTIGKAQILGIASIALFMQVLSGSRTSFAAAMLVFLVWSIVLKQRAKTYALLGVVLVGGLFVSVLPSLVPSLQRETSRIQDNSLTDLTGRTEFYRNGLQLIRERPWLGYGYAVAGKVWSDPRFSSQSFLSGWGSAKTSLHNGYLDVTIGSGIIGLALWVVILVTPLGRAFRLPMSDYKAIELVVLLQCLVVNFVESEITSSRTFGSLVFWLLWVVAGRSPSFLAEKKPEDLSYPVEKDRIGIFTPAT